MLLMSHRDVIVAAAAKITARDREYAADLMEDLAELGAKSLGSVDQQETIAQWFRKVRHEHVLMLSTATVE